MNASILVLFSFLVLISVTLTSPAFAQTAPTFLLENATENREIVVGENIDSLVPPITIVPQCATDSCTPLELAFPSGAPAAPSWLSLVKASDGTWSFEGTPTASDVGVNIVVIVEVTGHPDGHTQTLVLDVVTPLVPTFLLENAAENREIVVGENIDSLVPPITIVPQCATDSCAPLELAFSSIAPAPDWLSLVKASDGTWSFEGTPAATDVSVNIVVTVEVTGHPDGHTQTLVLDVVTPPVPTFVLENELNREIVVGENINSLDPPIIFIEQCPVLCTPLELAFPSELPASSWLNLVKASDGTWSFEGTPTESDVGLDIVVIVEVTGHPDDYTQVLSLDVVVTPTVPTFVLENELNREIVVGKNINSLVPPITFVPQCATDCAPLELAFPSGESAPSWLNLVKASDGTWSFEGTPTESDVGLDIVVIVEVTGHPDDYTQVLSLDVVVTPTVPTFVLENAEDREIVVGKNINSLVPPITFVPQCATDCAPLELAFSSRALAPDWLSLVKASNGTWSFEGTPAATDVGVNIVVIVEVTGHPDDYTQTLVLDVVTPPVPTFVLENTAEDREIVVGENINSLVPPITFVPQCATDLCAPLELAFSSRALAPDWLSLVKASNGTWSFEGTPAATDVGVDIVVIVEVTGHPDDYTQTLVLDVVTPPVPTFVLENELNREIVVGENINSLDPPIIFIEQCPVLCTPLELAFPSGESAPSWLSLVNASDGTWSFEGTPAATDVDLDIEVTVEVTGYPGGYARTLVLDVVATVPTFVLDYQLNREIVVGENINSLVPPITFVPQCATDSCAPLELAFSSSLLAPPSWLSLVKASDGTWSFEGTPAATDVDLDIEVTVEVTGHPVGYTRTLFLDVVVTSTQSVPTFALENAEDREIAVGENIDSLVPPITIVPQCATDSCAPLYLAFSSGAPAPDWLSLVEASNGTWSFEGTPAASDVGVDIEVIVEAIGHPGGYIRTLLLDVVVTSTQSVPTFALENAEDREIAVGENINSLVPPITFIEQCPVLCTPLELAFSSGESAAPDWLSLVKASNGTWSFEGTPTASDVGLDIEVIVEVTGHPDGYTQTLLLDVVAASTQPVTPSCNIELENASLNFGKANSNTLLSNILQQRITNTGLDTIDTLNVFPSDSDGVPQLFSIVEVEIDNAFVHIDSKKTLATGLPPNDSITLNFRMNFEHAESLQTPDDVISQNIAYQTICSGD